MAPAKLAGIHHLKIPVTNLARAVDFYHRIFGYRTTWEFPEADGVVRGVGGEVPGLGAMTLSFRVNPQAAEGCKGFDPISFAVDDRDDLVAWSEHLDAEDVPHSRIIEASYGWLLVFNDPDGLELHLYTNAEHGIDQSHRPGYGRRVN